MRVSDFARGRLPIIALGIFLFALFFLFTFLYTLPGETLLSPLRSSLARNGIEFSYEDARYVFPLGVKCRNVAIAKRMGPSVSFDSAVAAWEWTGLFRWLPFHLRAMREQSSVDVRTSPLPSNPGKVRISLSHVGDSDLGGIFPASMGFGFLADSLDLQWKKTGGAVSGAGEGSFSWLKLPIPAKDSPVQEALIKDVRMKFVVREGTIHVSSFTGTYEGSQVDGTGEIARFLTPASSSITFHLRIRNPFEGKVATLFDLVAKNAKNANLRIKGTLLSPTGEFQFF